MSSAPSSVSLVYIKWGKWLQKSKQLMGRSRRIIPKIVPNFVCHLHWRKIGWLSEDVISIFSTMLKG